MQISDSVLRHHLRNVYWIMGGACGGKTTQAEVLSRRHKRAHYNADEEMPTHKRLANPIDHPALCRTFDGWESYFGQPMEEYRAWLTSANNEAFAMVVLDLLGLSARQAPIYEGHTSVELVSRVADRERIVYLSPTDDVVRRDYLDRADHRDMVNLIRTLPKKDEICEKLLQMAIIGNRKEEAVARELGVAVIRRNAESSTDELSRQIEQRVGLGAGAER